TKLVHGGVRYLQQGNISLVVTALRERGRLIRNAPEIVKPLSLVIPTYSRWQTAYYTVGLSLYDLLAGKRRIGRSRSLSAQQIRKEAPGLEREGLKGGVLFHDAQFDDTRLSIAVARTCSANGGTLINYTKVVSLLKSADRVAGAVVEDVLTGVRREIKARVLVNCAGAFSDQVRQLDTDVEALISASQGSHLVLDRSFLAGSDSGVLIPETSDGRVLFAIPWHNRVLAGTTDVPILHIELDPKPANEEIDFILNHLGRYLAKKPGRSDILSSFAGIRPLIKGSETRTTAAISRDHRVIVSSSGMVSVLGGKWTTFRAMAEDAVDQAIKSARLTPLKRSITKTLRLHDCEECSGSAGDSSSPADKTPERAAPIHPSVPYTIADVVRAVREEWACTLEDVLARRTRFLILDARASIEASEKVAAVMAVELGRDQFWQDEQIASFRNFAATYIPSSQ
ncbi:MAG: glycerol-3-phosphate dehydrogenase/oxidase, partial [bacterium]